MNYVLRALVLVLVAALAPIRAFSQDVYSGWERQLSVSIPRLDASAVIDGVLDDEAWASAARLTGFSQYQPVDGRPAEEPTDVYVWYSPDAIYFGIRATEVHGDVVRATRANRDNIASEDQIQILLDTENDRRVAFLFSVNPLGVQADGTRSDSFGGGAGGRSATGGGSRMINFMDGNIDLNPDYVFESKGRLTPTGYEVEVRIPFKSLRYQDSDPQTWGLHILRRSMHSGFQDSWAPAVRASSSFLVQSGELAGLHDLHRGLVLEVTPTAVGRLSGVERSTGEWGYDRAGELSADVRWGIKQNLTLNGTVNPDFSQVEADVGQVTLNERFALFYPEKRPFFLDGLELFDTPGQLIYTRQIVAPVAGAKLAGKVGDWNVATILAADDSSHSDPDGTAYVGIVRARRDFGQAVTLGGVATVREEGSGEFSRLAGLDARLYHNRMYYVEVQAVGSWAEHGGESGSGQMFNAVWDRTGRGWGFRYEVGGKSPEFEAASGFVNRTNIIEASASNRGTVYGAQDALVQTASAFLRLERIWAWDDPGAGAIEGTESVWPSATLAGGWNLGGAINRKFYAYEPFRYANYTVNGEAFTVPGIEDNQWSGSVSVTSPTWQVVSATASYGFGRTPIFDEAAPGRSRQISATVDLRPTDQLRATIQLSRLVLERRRDDSRYSSEIIPRLKIEYQISPAVFVRVIGQYTDQERSALRDRTGALITRNGSTDTALDRGNFQTDWLFSYRPVPGTLLYLGYSSTLEQRLNARPGVLDRQVDGFFAKISYTIRS